MKNPELVFGRLGNRLFQGAYLYAQMKKGEIPDIYVQDYKLFEPYIEEIKQWYGDGIGFLPYVAVHLRRGDYVNNSFYTQLWETGYYIDACNRFPGRQFLVFSDDLEFARKYFEGSKFLFSELTDPVETLNQIASCDGHVIANSSFSYWGALLSPHHGKVIRPKLWFADGKERITFPKDWISL